MSRIRTLFAALLVTLGVVVLAGCPILDDPEDEETVSDGSEPDPQPGPENPPPDQPDPPQ